MQTSSPRARLAPTCVILGAALALATPAAANTAPDAHAAAQTSRERREAHFGAFGNFLSGQFATSQTDLDTAAKHYLAALALDPAIPELRDRALLAAIIADRPEAARLARAEATNPAAIMLLADLDGLAGHWPAAITRLRALPRQSSGEVLRPLLLAWARYGAGRTDEALATLRAAAATPRYAALFNLHMALIADAAGRTSDAAHFYDLASNNGGSVGLRLGQILASWQARHGNPETAARRLSEYVAADGPLRLALPALRAQLATRPVATARDGFAESYVAVAAALNQAQGNDLALLLLRYALQMRPDFAAARLLQADILAAQQQPAQALAALGAIGPQDPLAPVARLRSASILAGEGKTGPAVAILDALATEYPDRGEPLEQKGEILRADNQFAAAAAAFTTAIARLQPFDPITWRLYFERGVSLERAGDWDHAEPDLEHAVQLAPRQPSVLNYLAYSWADQGKHLVQAREMLESAALLQPEDGAVIDSLGWVKLRQGDTAGAIAALERAAELQTEDATINMHLGDAYARAGRKLEAVYQWRRVLSLKPDPDDRAHVEKELAETEAALATATPAEAPATTSPDAPPPAVPPAAPTRN